MSRFPKVLLILGLMSALTGGLEKDDDTDGNNHEDDRLWRFKMLIATVAHFSYLYYFLYV